MIIIKLRNDAGTYWTEKYTNKEGFLEFETKTKEGKVFTNMINKNDVVSMTEVGEVDTNKKVEKKPF